MSSAAEPRQASLPLPGGRPDATVRLHPLLVATMSAPPDLIAPEAGKLAGLRGRVGADRDDLVQVPTVAFAVEHPGAGTILIDTGLHGSAAIDPSQAFGRRGGIGIRDVEMDPDGSVPDRLRALGINLGSVHTVVMTHLHADHAGGIGQFPDATFVLDATEWTAAVVGHERDGYVPRQFDHAFDYRLLDFEGPDAGSFSSFGHALDLFGDGSVTLVSTPGHSAGHLSVILRTSGPEVLVAGDAVPTMAALDDDLVPGRTLDEHRFRRSLREVGLYLRQTPDAVVIPGHDLARWRELADVY